MGLQKLLSRFVGMGLWSLFLVSTAYAQSPGVVLRDNTAVRSEASTKGEILLRLKRGDKVTVISQDGQWVKVKVALDQSFHFDGYIFHRLVKWRPSTRTAAKAPTPKPTPQPKATPTPTPKPEVSNLDQFFETPGQKTEPTPKAPKAALKEESKPKREVASQRDMDSEKGSLGAGISYVLFNIKLSNGGATPGKVFAYNMGGIGADVTANYWFMEMNALRIGGKVRGQYAMFTVNTNLQNNTGTTFGEVKSKSTSLLMDARLPIQYRFESPVFRSIGLDLGGRYYNFKGDDIEDVSGGIGLYLEQNWISILGGLNAEFAAPSVEGLGFRVGLDVLALNFFSENDTATVLTGTDASPKMGWMPSLGIHWTLAQRHRLGFLYELRLQKVNFSGAGFRVSTTLDSASVQNTIHNAGLTYEFLF